MSEGETLSKVYDVVRKRVQFITEIHNPKVYQLIDWNKGYRVINNIIEQVYPDYEIGDTSVIVVDVKDLKGYQMFYSIKIQLVDPVIIISDLFDGLDLIDEEVHIEYNEIIKAIIAKGASAILLTMMKNKSESAPSFKSACSNCGRSDLQLNIVVNASEGKTEHICAVCMNNFQSKENDGDLPSLEELELSIKKIKKMIKTLEKDLPNLNYEPLPPEIERYAITPISMYKSFQAILADYKIKKMKVLMRMDNASKLKNELKKALKNEDFELAAVLRDKLDKISTHKS